MTILANPPTDLDALLAPRTSTAIADTGFKYGGTDLAARYEMAASGTPAANIGFLKAGVDVGPLFAAKGSTLQWNAPANMPGPTTFTPYGLAYGAGVYIAVGSGGGLAMYSRSTDGTTWSTPTSLGSSGILYGIIYTGSEFIAVGGNNTTWWHVHTTDGTSWGSLTQVGPVAGNGYARAIISNGSTLVMVGASSAATAYRLRAAYSTNGGATWTTPTDLPGPTTQAIPYAVAWNGTYFVMVGAYNSPIYSFTAYSADGITWSTPAYLPSTGAAWLRALVLDGTRLIAVGNNNGPQFSYTYTDDGVNWQALTTPTDSNWGANALVKTSLGLVAMGGTSGLYGNWCYAVSTDSGANWALRTLYPGPVAFAALAAVYVSGRIVAVGQSANNGYGMYVTSV